MAGGILIDGSRGEGGGQILRSSLTLAMLTGTPVRVTRIRSNRKKAGLAAQHLCAVRAAARCCGGRLAGAEPGSVDLLFKPGPVKAGNFVENIGTAGAVSLVLQTVALPLALADGPSRVGLTGGTHVPWSPSCDFLQSDWCPTLEALGFRISVRLRRSGYYPEGGGEVLALIPGGGRPKPLELRFRGNLRSIVGTAFFSNQPRVIGEEITREARRHLRRAGVAARVESRERPARGSGSGLHLEAIMEDDHRMGFASLSGRGKSPEKVARDAVNALFSWLDSGSGLTPHLSDQILIPLSLAEGPSVFTTSRITPHLLTNAGVVQQFRLARIRVGGKIGGPGEVRVEPTGDAGSARP